MVCRLTNGKLNIFLDTDALERVRCNLLESFYEYLRNGTLVNKKGKTPSEQEITNAINILYNTALLLFQNNVVQIFDYLPLTKQGYFNKSKNVLIKTSDLRDIFFGYEYFAQSKLQLRLVPDDELNAHLSLDFFSTSNNKEQAILDEGNNFVQVSVKRNSYLNGANHIAGHVYRDAKDNKYLYLGEFYVAENKIYSGGNYSWVKRCSCLQEFMQSEQYAREFERASMLEDQLRYIKVTKKLEKLLSDAQTTSDVIYAFVNAVPFDDKWDEKIKKLKNPIKAVEDCGQVFSSEMNVKWFSRDFEPSEKRPKNYKGYDLVTYQCYIIPKRR